MWCSFATRSISVLKPMLHTSLAIYSIVCKMLVWWLHFDTGFFQHFGVQSNQRAGERGGWHICHSSLINNEIQNWILNNETQTARIHNSLY